MYKFHCDSTHTYLLVSNNETLNRTIIGLISDYMTDYQVSISILVMKQCDGYKLSMSI